MFRRVVISGGGEGSKRAKYRVRGARPLAQYRAIDGVYTTVGANSMYNAIVFDDAVLLSITSALTSPYVFDLEVSENQPRLESIEVQAGVGIALEVYNENGVLVCDNGVKPSGSVSTPSISAPGEMTSVPGEEPGEMAVETTNDPCTTI